MSRAPKPVRRLLLFAGAGVAVHAREQGDFFGRQHAFDVEDDDEMTVHLAHALYEISADSGAEAGWGLDVGAWDLQHFIDRIDDHTQILALLADAQFDDDDAGAT